MSQNRADILRTRFRYPLLQEFPQEIQDTYQIQHPAKGTHHSGVRELAPAFIFTELGVTMLSSVLHSNRAIHVNIEIMRAFVRLRQMLASNVALARQLAALESKSRRSGSPCGDKSAA